MEKFLDWLHSRWLLIVALIALALLILGLSHPAHAEAQANIVAEINVELAKESASCEAKYSAMSGQIANELHVMPGTRIDFVFGAEVVPFGDPTPTMDYLTEVAMKPGAFGVRFPDGTYELIAPGGPFGCSISSVNNP